MANTQAPSPALLQALQSDPDFQAYQAIIRADTNNTSRDSAQSFGSARWQQMMALQQKLQQKYQASGLLPKGFAIAPNGSIAQSDWLSRNFNKLWTASGIAFGANLAGPAIASALNGGEEAAASTAGAGSTTAGAATAGAATAGAATAGAAGTSSLLTSLLPTIIGAGTSLGGAAIATHGQTEAAKIAAESADKQAQIQKEIYEQARADAAPYRNLGYGGVNNLAYLSGITLPAAESTSGTPSPYIVPGAVDANGNPYPGRATTSEVPNATLAQQGRTTGPQTVTQGTPLTHAGLAAAGAGSVRVQNPQTGLVHLMSPADADAAVAAGGVRI